MLIVYMPSMVYAYVYMHAFIHIFLFSCVVCSMLVRLYVAKHRRQRRLDRLQHGLFQGQVCASSPQPAAGDDSVLDADSAHDQPSDVPHVAL